MRDQGVKKSVRVVEADVWNCFGGHCWWRVLDVNFPNTEVDSEVTLVSLQIT